MFCGQNATTLKGTVIVVHTVHIVLLKLSNYYRRWMTENGQLLRGPRPISRE